ncbi:MAG: DUF2231 domain-containing protein [Candidatus Eiseniibacteriota bacterium]
MAAIGRTGRWAIRPGAPPPATLLCLVALLAAPTPAAAHQGHRRGAEAKPAAASDSTPSAPGDTMPAHGAPAAAGGRAEGERVAAAPFVMPPLRDALLDHVHNKIVHFPLALGVAAAFLLLVALRRPQLEAAGRWLVWLAALGGVAAYISGRLQEQAFEGEPKEWLVDLHEKWGLATAITLVVWALLTLWKPARKLVWLWGLVAAALALVAGFYGGIVAHGE